MKVLNGWVLALSTALILTGLVRPPYAGAASEPVLVGVGSIFNLPHFEQPLSYWRWAIEDALKRPVYELVGYNSLPPQEIVWDGKGSDGRYLAYDPNWRVSSSFVTSAGQARYGLGYLRMSMANQGSTEWQNAYQPIVASKWLPSMVGGELKILTPYTYGSGMFLRLTITSTDGSYMFARSGWIYELGSSQKHNEVFTFAWDGRADDGSIFPDGTYELGLSFDYYVSLNDIYHGSVTSDLIIGQQVTDNQTPVEDPTVAEEPDVCSNRNPVLLIHGLNSYPSMWNQAETDYVDLLRSSGYPKSFIQTYSYSGQGAGLHGYNNQGGVEEISRGVRQAVSNLSLRSVACGGSGQIDIVAHSMGGLVARQYLAEYGSDSMLGKIISVGTPYHGGWPLAWNNNQYASQAAKVVNQLAKNSLGLSDYWNYDLDGQAYADLTPGSSVQQRLYNLSYSGQTVTYALYGDIRAAYTVKLFEMVVSSGDVELGDLVVPKESARHFSANQIGREVAFSGDKALMNMTLKLKGLLANYEVEQLRLDSLRFKHTSIMAQPELKQTILRLLSS